MINKSFTLTICLVVRRHIRLAYGRATAWMIAPPPDGMNARVCARTVEATAETQRGGFRSRERLLYSDTTWYSLASLIARPAFTSQYGRQGVQRVDQTVHLLREYSHRDITPGNHQARRRRFTQVLGVLGSIEPSSARTWTAEFCGAH